MSTPASIKADAELAEAEDVHGWDVTYACEDCGHEWSRRAYEDEPSPEALCPECWSDAGVIC